MEISIFNSTGQLIFSEKKQIPKGYSFTTLPFNNLANGVYFIKFASGSFSKTIEVIHSK